VTGHRGCGKSTELRQLQARLREDGFFAIYLDVEDVLDLGEITYQDVLVAIAKEVERDLRENKIKINRRLLEELDLWFAEKVLTEEQRENVELTLKTEYAIEPKYRSWLECWPLSQDKSTAVARAERRFAGCLNKNWASSSKD
jgi:hypothetical protein